MLAGLAGIKTGLRNGIRIGVRNRKRIFAMGMSLSLAAVNFSACSNGAGNDEAGLGAPQQAEVQDDVQEIEDALAGLSDSGLISHSSTAGKEETVYVMLDADGNPTTTLVSEWLKNAKGAQTLTDTSNLKNIRVVKGDSTFEQNGELLTWNTGGADVYYQGESEGQLPVTVKISYELDGKKVNASELDGATGHLKITFNYENNTGTQRLIHGEMRTIYQPFMVISGMMFDNDKVSNVEVEDGKSLNSGDKTLVFGVAMPGLSDSLGLNEMEDEDGKSIDIDIREQVVVDADVKDFSLMMTLSIVTDNALDQLGLDDFDTLDDLKEDMNKLSDGMDDIIDGATQLRDGVQELSDGTGELSDGTDDLSTGASDLSDGAHKLLSGASAIDSGINTLKKGIDSADDGAKKLKTGMDQLQAKLPALSDGVTSLQSGAAQVSGGLGTLNSSLTDASALAKLQALQTGSSAVKGGLAQASAGLDQIVAGYDPESGDLATLLTSLTAYGNALVASGDAASMQYGQAVLTLVGTYQSLYTNVSTATAGVDALNKNYPAVDDGINTLVGNMATITESVGKLNTGAAAVSAGLDSLNSQMPDLSQGVSDLSTGMTTLSEGTGKLKAGAAKLKKGSSDLKDGALDLAEGAGKLYDGTKDLKDGVKELVDGVSELLDGTGELKDGVIEFNDEGIT